MPTKYLNQAAAARSKEAIRAATAVRRAIKVVSAARVGIKSPSVAKNLERVDAFLEDADLDLGMVHLRCIKPASSREASVAQR